jgi:hypothetical protein
MEGTVRIIGMDIHRVAAEVVSLLDGEIVKLGRVQMLRNKLEEFARKELTHDDHVVIEATGNAAAVAEVLSPHVDRIVIANPKQVHMIAHAKVKTDTIDATVLAKLYASGFLGSGSGDACAPKTGHQADTAGSPAFAAEEPDPVNPPRPPDPAVSAWEPRRDQRAQMADEANIACG